MIERRGVKTKSHSPRRWIISRIFFVNGIASSSIGKCESSSISIVIVQLFRFHLNNFLRSSISTFDSNRRLLCFSAQEEGNNRAQSRCFKENSMNNLGNNIVGIFEAIGERDLNAARALKAMNLFRDNYQVEFLLLQLSRMCPSCRRNLF